MTTTWLDELPSEAPLSADHRLWVPMRIQALVFAKAGTTSFIDLSPDYNALNNSTKAPLGIALKRDLNRIDTVPPVLRPGTKRDMARGIHLHWSLPAGFGHVRPTAGDGESSAPLVPDRWLVTRLWAGDALAQKSWLVESDHFGQKNEGVPWFASDGVRCKVISLGRVVDPTNAAAPRTTKPFLTAFAPGNLAFAAFYPSCRGVFGFHDEDACNLPAATQCTYLVCGWFSDVKADPLAVATRGEWVAGMQKLNWSVAMDTRVLPTRLMCHGALSGVQWSPNTTCDDDPSPPMRVALGNGIFDAIAALSKNPDAPDYAALSRRLLSELQFAELSRRRPTPGLAKGDDTHSADLSRVFAAVGRFDGLRARVHERSFSPHPGGTAWEIVRKDSAEEANGKPLVLLPDEISRLLCELNQLQRSCDETERELVGARRRLFAAWYQLQYRSREVAKSDPALDRLRERLDAARKEVERLAPRRAELSRGLRVRPQPPSGEMTLREQIAAALKRAVPDHDLVPHAMPRFWRASDPFVLLSGLPVPEIQGGRSPLQCRASNQLVQFRIDNVPTYGQIAVDRDALRRAAAALLPSGPAAPTDAAELLLDVLLADPMAADLLAPLTFTTYVNPDPNQIREVAQRIRDAQLEIAEASAAVERGEDVPRGIAIDCGASTPAFLSSLNRPAARSAPVFMLWQVRWLPDHRSAPDAAAEGVAPPDMLAGWSFSSDRVDYARSCARAAGGEPTIYEGFTILAHNLEQGFAHTTERFPSHKFLFERLQGLAGQSLAGLTDMFGMLDTGPQVPPLRGPGDLQIDDGMRALIGDGYAEAPLVRLATGTKDDLSHFFPLRGGQFTLSRLWLVDTFGRVRRIIETLDNKNLRTPEALRISSALASGTVGRAQLAPRLVLPARLLFRWLSAGDDQQESVGDLQTSPICGWIVYNRMDRGLVIYAADGRVLGAIQPVRRADGLEAVRWTWPPMRPLVTPRPLTEAEIGNRHLRGFVNGLLVALGAEAGGGFEDLRELVERLEDAAPIASEHGLQSVLAGRPLALVRASLCLEIDGPPLTDQSRGWLRAANVPDARPAYTRQKFSVRLGDRRLGADGLIGYAVGDGSDASYTRLKLSSEQKPNDTGQRHAYFDHEQVLELACTRPGERALYLTLLLDPTQGVHVVSGILPTSVVTLPSSLVAAAKADLQMPFLVPHLLGERDRDPKLQPAPAMPLPTDGHDDWFWVSHPARGAPPDEVPARSDLQPASTLATRKALYEGWLKYRPAKARKP